MNLHDLKNKGKTQKGLGKDWYRVNNNLGKKLQRYVRAPTGKKNKE